MASIEDFMLPCLNKKFFGIECMGCGMQRSILLVFQGKFEEAFFMYPAIYSLMVLMGVIVFSLFKNFKNSNKIITILAILNGVIILTNFILKTFINN
jgi:hypothetical protein